MCKQERPNLALRQEEQAQPSPRQNTAPCSRAKVICRCLRVSEAELLRVLGSPEVQTIQDLRRQTGAGDGCMACHRLLRRYLAARAEAPTSVAS